MTAEKRERMIAALGAAWMAPDDSRSVTEIIADAVLLMVEAERDRIRRAVEELPTEVLWTAAAFSTGEMGEEPVEVLQRDAVLLALEAEE